MTTTTYTLLFAPTTVARTTWLDRSRDSYELDLDTTWQREETFASFSDAARAAWAFCGPAAVCSGLCQDGPVEFFADADAREIALRDRKQVEGCEHNYLACIIRNEPQVACDQCPF